jgi:CRISPR/Cas system endoribonuclease Cas6 (RAMP superfamily)
MRTRPQLRVVDRVDGCVRASARARRDAAASPGIGQGTLVGLGAVRYRRVSV